MSHQRLPAAQRFFEGNPCIHGHGTRRYRSCGSCVECIRMASRASRDALRGTPWPTRGPRYWARWLISEEPSA